MQRFRNVFRSILEQKFKFDWNSISNSSSSTRRRIFATPFVITNCYTRITGPPCITLRWPIASHPPPSGDIVTQIKPHCWKAGELIGRSRASSSKLALPRNLWAARGMPMLPIERAGAPDKTFASLTGVGIRARGGCRYPVRLFAWLETRVGSHRAENFGDKTDRSDRARLHRWSRVDKYLVARVNLLIRSDDALEDIRFLFFSSSLLE